MLQTMRSNAQGTIAKVIVGFLIVVFALWGVESIVTMGGGERAVVEVDGEEITEAEIARAVEQQKINLSRQFGERYDENLFNEQFLRQSAIEQLIEQKVALVQARELGLVAAQRSIDETIVQIPAFQVEGKFDRERFQAVLRNNGLTPLTFRNGLAEEILTSQASAGFVLTTFKTPFAAQFATALDQEQRTFRFVEVNASALEAGIQLSAEEIQAAYEATQERFRTPEQVSVNYVLIKRNDLVAKQTVSEDDLKKAYAQYQDREAQQEQRKASHILLETGDRSEKEALELAAELKKRIDAGESFEALAKEYSDDIGTSQAGGDLGLTTRGSFVDEFEDALYALNKGEVSAPVKTEFGVHLIKATDIVKSEIKSLAAMRAELTETVREAKAFDAFNAQVRELSDVSFSAESLAEVAQAVGAKVEQTALFTRDAGEGIALSSNVRESAFSDAILFDKEISSVIEHDGYALVLAVNEHKPEAVQPLAEVEPQVVAGLKRERALSQAKTSADAIAAGTEKASKWTKVTTTYAQASDAPRAAQQRAFALVKDQAAVVGTPGGYSVVVVDAIASKDWTAVEAGKEAVEAGRGQNSRNDFFSYQAWSRAVTNVER